MPDSIPQQFIGKVVETLTGAAPQGVKVRKGRKAPTNEAALPMVQVYWHVEQSKAIGNPLRPMLLSRTMTLEIKVTVTGDDDAFDVQRQWIIAAMWNAGNFGKLVKNVTEAETVPYLEDSSVNDQILAGAIRYAVEYTTLPGDITAGN